MKKTIKRPLSLLLLCALMCTLLCSLPLEPRARAAVMFNNTQTASMSVNCDQNGKVNIDITFRAATGVSASATMKTYIEKRGFLGLFWTRVDIEPANDEWIDTTTASSFSTTHQHTLASGGRYRVTTEFTVSGNGGATDQITRTQIIDY